MQNEQSIQHACFPSVLIAHLIVSTYAETAHPAAPPVPLPLHLISLCLLAHSGISYAMVTFFVHLVESHLHT